MDGERIVEGSDVYMECLVQAKPKPYKVFSSGGLFGEFEGEIGSGQT